MTESGTVYLEFNFLLLDDKPRGAEFNSFLNIISFALLGSAISSFLCLSLNTFLGSNGKLKSCDSFADIRLFPSTKTNVRFFLGS